MQLKSSPFNDLAIHVVDVSISRPPAMLELGVLLNSTLWVISPKCDEGLDRFPNCWSDGNRRCAAFSYDGDPEAWVKDEFQSTRGGSEGNPPCS
ncbi:hypothetical protein GALMADRAFT_1228847 [Galerina marginata CBS 339.88]|uniref:Uncharacterized protein n=1 Tax=Galerina marginata (strain CBS 339.88) TaxID=685588 RepID=A0A067TA21_GALM3|nr:hypothetical protein GALMADRAFT_1228847 [Galerina marginata CBS 339.88]